MKKTEKMQEKGFLYRRYTQEQGKRYGQTGSETACNRERYGMSLNLNARPHKLGRAPLYLGAPVLICWSGRPNLATCRLAPCYMPSRSLFARTFSPVPTYIFAKGIPFLAFFPSFSFFIVFFFVYLQRVYRKRE